jgi:hypothetical protein
MKNDYKRGDRVSIYAYDAFRDILYEGAYGWVVNSSHSFYVLVCLGDQNSDQNIYDEVIKVHRKQLRRLVKKKWRQPPRE